MQTKGYVAGYGFNDAFNFDLNLQRQDFICNTQMDSKWITLVLPTLHIGSLNYLKIRHWQDAHNWKKKMLDKAFIQVRK